MVFYLIRLVIFSWFFLFYSSSLSHSSCFKLTWRESFIFFYFSSESSSWTWFNVIFILLNSLLISPNYEPILSLYSYSFWYSLCKYWFFFSREIFDWLKCYISSSLSIICCLRPAIVSLALLCYFYILRTLLFRSSIKLSFIWSSSAWDLFLLSIYSSKASIFSSFSADNWSTLFLKALKLSCIYSIWIAFSSASFLYFL